MQKFIACFVCIFALHIAAMPVMIAEDPQNSTGNISLNQTKNDTENISLNETQNATALNASNRTEDVALSISPVIAPNMSQNATQRGAQSTNQHTKVLRAGFDKSRHLNNLDVYSNRSTYSIPGSNVSSAVDLGQCSGNASKFAYNTDSYKPRYNVSQYSRTKPIYEVPHTPSKPVYSISDYPVIKAPNSIP